MLDTTLGQDTIYLGEKGRLEVVSPQSWCLCALLLHDKPMVSGSKLAALQAAHLFYPISYPKICHQAGCPLLLKVPS